MDSTQKLFDMLGMADTGGPSDDRKMKDALGTTRKLLAQAVAGERKALTRAQDAEAALASMKRRAQNNIDRAFNKGVKAAGGSSNVERIVRHPEFGTDE